MRVKYEHTTAVILLIKMMMTMMMIFGGGGNFVRRNNNHSNKYNNIMMMMINCDRSMIMVTDVLSIIAPYKVHTYSSNSNSIILRQLGHQQLQQQQYRYLTNDHWNTNYRTSIRRYLQPLDDSSNININDDVKTQLEQKDSMIATTKTSTITNDDDSIINDDSQYYNKNNVKDQVFSAISGDGGIKVTVCTIRNMVNDLMIQHSMTPISTEALGRTVSCGLLMANGIQDEQILQISIRTEDGPLRGIVTVVSGIGEVRGYVGTPMLGKDWTLSDAVGKIGSVQIVKNHPSWPRPYNGITAVRYGDIDRDIGIYLAESEQRSCALAASCSFPKYDNNINSLFLCRAAGGYLVELLPDCSDEVKEQVEKNLASLVQLNENEEKNQLPTNLLIQGKTPYDICNIILNDLDMKPLQQIFPKIKCPCTQERLIRSLKLLPIEDVDDILNNEQKLEARCEFCGKVYNMTPNEVRQYLASSKTSTSSDIDTL